jgi:hypothetical protein
VAARLTVDVSIVTNRRKAAKMRRLMRDAAGSIVVCTDPAITSDRRRARRLARRFGGRFIVGRWRGRRAYWLTGAAGERAIAAAIGKGEW